MGGLCMPMPPRRMAFDAFLELPQAMQSPQTLCSHACHIRGSCLNACPSAQVVVPEGGVTVLDRGENDYPTNWK